MANAGRRLLGTLLSGLAYQWGGLVMYLGVLVAFLLLAWVFELPAAAQHSQGRHQLTLPESHMTTVGI